MKHSMRKCVFTGQVPESQLFDPIYQNPGSREHVENSSGIVFPIQVGCVCSGMDGFICVGKLIMQIKPLQVSCPACRKMGNEEGLKGLSWTVTWSNISSYPRGVSLDKFANLKRKVK